ncbi:hypothetical protein J6590_005911 [Homalodisca vitripennis]|nr:hypothetical protein J6590_005911 [Homalodisca vitripennis]
MRLLLRSLSMSWNCQSWRENYLSPLPPTHYGPPSYLVVYGPGSVHSTHGQAEPLLSSPAAPGFRRAATLVVAQVLIPADGKCDLVVVGNPLTRGHVPVILNCVTN